jgi:hypothetical protein
MAPLSGGSALRRRVARTEADRARTRAAARRDGDPDDEHEYNAEAAPAAPKRHAVPKRTLSDHADWSQLGRVLGLALVGALLLEVRI